MQLKKLKSVYEHFVNLQNSCLEQDLYLLLVPSNFSLILLTNPWIQIHDETLLIFPVPIPKCAESSFLVNISPISAISDVKQKNVSASACSGRTIHYEISHSRGTPIIITFPRHIWMLEEHIIERAYYFIHSL